MKNTVVLADDHGLVREGLATCLADTPDLAVVAAVASGDDVLAAAKQHAADVVVLDIDMPGLDAFEAARRVQTDRPEARVLFLSAHQHDHYIELALAAGASGYVSKSEPLEQVLTAVRTVARGGIWFSDSIRERLIIDTTGVRLGTARQTRATLLSPREREVLRHVAQGLSNKDIAAALHVTARTVEHHIERLSAKLDVHGRVNLARYALREGLLEP